MYILPFRLASSSESASCYVVFLLYTLEAANKKCLDLILFEVGQQKEPAVDVLLLFPPLGKLLKIHKQNP